MPRLLPADPGVFTVAMTGKNFATIADAFALVFFGAGFVVLSLCAGAATLSADGATGMRVVSLGLLIAGASAVIGWLLGLLFGIPRTLARPQPAVATGTGPTAAASAPTSRVNTNLEDVSDWKPAPGSAEDDLATIPGDDPDMVRLLSA